MTYSGVEFYPLDPRAEEIRIEDIAHALSNLCRYGGHVRRFYSVAEHSVSVAKACVPRCTLWGLLHDAAEAYLVDLPAPIKNDSRLGELYREAEGRLMRAICTRFGLRWGWGASEEVQRADAAMVWIESRVLMAPHPIWERYKRFAAGLEEFTGDSLEPPAAEGLFLVAFWRLQAQRG